MLTVEQVITAQKASLGNIFGVSARAYEGFEKLVELNLQAGKASLAEAADTARAALAAKDAQEIVALQTSAVQPSVDKLAAYGRQAYDIVAATNADIGKIAEETIAEAQKTFAASFEQAVKNAPAGTENAVTFLQSAVAAANSAYESVQKAVKQAADVAEANVEAVAATATKAAGAARSKRAAA